MSYSSSLFFINFFIQRKKGLLLRLGFVPLDQSEVNFSSMGIFGVLKFGCICILIHSILDPERDRTLGIRLPHSHLEAFTNMPLSPQPSPPPPPHRNIRNLTYKQFNELKNQVGKNLTQHAILTRALISSVFAYHYRL